MVSLRQRSRDDDPELVRRVGAGDTAAFATIDERHRPALTRYAGTLLRRSEHDAQDVVQDVLIRAHDVLRAGNGPNELRPWLFRLTRNRAIDEVRRARWGHAALDSEAIMAADGREDPAAVLRRKEAVRRLVEDLADLPVSQRTALLARELDGQSPAQVAAHLGVSVEAAQKLAVRARENLVKTRAARDADCPDVRAVLLDARERRVRCSEHALRHVKSCAPCRSYQRDLRRLSSQLHALNPAWGLPLFAAVANLLGGGTKVAAGVTAAVAIAATGGVIVLESDVFKPGDPAPFRLGGVRTPGGLPVKAGDPVPRGNVVITTRVRIPAARPPSGEVRSATMQCPAGMKFASIVIPEQRTPVGALGSVGVADETIPGYSTRGQIRFYPGRSPRDVDVTVGIVCRRPDARGSVVEHPRGVRPGEQPGRICANPSQYVHESAGGMFKGYVWRGQPVAIQRHSKSGRWTQIVADDGHGGWVKTSALCP